MTTQKHYYLFTDGIGVFKTEKPNVNDFKSSPFCESGLCKAYYDCIKDWLQSGEKYPFGEGEEEKFIISGEFGVICLNDLLDEYANQFKPSLVSEGEILSVIKKNFDLVEGDINDIHLKAKIVQTVLECLQYNNSNSGKSNEDLVNKHVHLRFEMYDAPNVHPQKVMKELGIAYQHATPQSMGDQWWFWNCVNVPSELPKYLTIANWNPMEMIGYGLSQEDAEKIRDYKK